MAEITGFENQQYCNFNDTGANAVAGKDILLAIFDDTGTKLLAIAGQQGLTINRSKDSIEVTSKDTVGGWKSKIAGMKEWSIDNDGLYVADDESHKILGKAFEEDIPVCIKVVNYKKKVPMFGGLTTLTDYSLEAPYDDAMTYSISLDGMGALIDLSELEDVAQMPGDDPKADAPVEVTGVTADPTTLSVAVGKTATFTIAVAPTNATDQTASAKSADETKATASVNGTIVTVTGVAATEADTPIVVTTTVGTKTVDVTVTVTAE